MGAYFSTPLENPNSQNSSSSISPPTIPSTSPNFQNPDSKSLENQNPLPETLDNQNPDPKTDENQNPESSDQPETPKEPGEEEEEEEGECGFCLFMKGGGCKDEFIAWENCVEESEKDKEDVVDKCFEVTGNLKKCMEAHSEYYEPILRAEKAANEELKNEVEREGKNSDETNEERVVQIEVEKEG